MIHGLTALWPPATALPSHSPVNMLALLAVLLAGFLLLKFMNDDYEKKMLEEKKSKPKEEPIEDTVPLVKEEFQNAMVNE